jgi:NYN domain/OST-HTH/LOTUS domain
MVEEKKFAVLIDADNVSAKYIKYVLDEVSNYGVATYKRIYGDWTKPSTASWKEVLLDNSITPVQQYSYTQGKNATDSAMIIDAMDILYSNNVGGFCIVSSDSDFTKLSSRLRESGMLVVGMGEKKTPKPFISACNQFKYLDVLAETEKQSLKMEETNPVEEALKPEIKQEFDVKLDPSQKTSKNMTELNVIKTTVLKMMNEVDTEDQSMNIGELGSKLVKRYPDFDVRNYGYTKLSRLLRDFDFLKIDAKGKNGTSIYVSLKPNQINTPKNTEQIKKTRKPNRRKKSSK